MKFISGYKQLNDDTSPFSGKYVAKENVLAVGDVQSGKTKWIIETIKDSTDNGYKIIILFGGYTNILNDQSFDRCWQELRRTYPGIMLKKSISADDYKYFNMTNQEQPIVYTLLKSADNIKKIDETFLEGISDIKRYPILIIDDETDYASPNTKITNVSAVHKNFCKLIKTVQKGKIIQVTATPFSNILAKASDPYFPDRIICLKHNDEYCGLDKFLNDSNYKHLSYKKNEFLDNYIRESLACFAASCCFYDSPKYEFLINIDSKREIHDKVTEKLLEILNKWSTNKPKNIKEFNDVLESRFRNQSKNIDRDVLLRKMHSVIKYLYRNFEQADSYYGSIVILNQGHTYDSECISDTNKYSVIIGGTLLSRGVTFKYLSTELILNSPDVSSFAIDTMMQRARWLGYRLDKQEYMTVIMSDKIYNGYKEATETFIKFNKYLKKNYKDIKLIKSFLLETQKDHLDKINLKWTNKPMGK